MRVGLWLTAALLAGCAHLVRPDVPVDAAAREGRLEARPNPPARLDIVPGRQPLELGNERDGVMYVPRGYHANRPVPLLLLLHGATGNGDEILDAFQDVADELNVVVLAPDSRGVTWDVVTGELGRDVAFIERALERTFARVAIDPSHVAVGGFSDGASYALTLGLANGDLFQAAMAFSPGFLAKTKQQGSPRLFLSHGTADHILPIDQTSRPMAEKLRQAGYRLELREFDGRHTVPPEIARAAFTWWLERF